MAKQPPAPFGLPAPQARQAGRERLPVQALQTGRGRQAGKGDSFLPSCPLASLPFSFTILFLFTKVKLYVSQNFIDVT
jgi:hypothetical protein